MPLPALAIPALLKLGEGLIDRFFPDPKAANEAKMELFRMERNGELAQLAADTELAKGQLAVNAAEAASGGYAGSWRPTIGYVCAAALAFTYVVNPLLAWFVVIFDSTIPAPTIAIDDHLWELMIGMLGLAGWRSLDKIKAK